MLEKIKSLVTEKVIFDFLAEIKEQILEYTQKELAGAEKKKQIVDTVIAKIMVAVKAFDFPGFDTPYDKVIEALLNIAIPALVQFIYDLVFSVKKG